MIRAPTCLPRPSLAQLQTARRQRPHCVLSPIQIEAVFCNRHLQGFGAILLHQLRVRRCRCSSSATEPWEALLLLFVMSSFAVSFCSR